MKTITKKIKQKPNPENSKDFKECFSEELNSVYLNKKRLISFLTELIGNDRFVEIQSQLRELRDETKHQLQKIENIFLLADDANMNNKAYENIPTKFETFIINDNHNLMIKNKLSLMLYLKMIEGKETDSIKKAKILAQMLNYSRCAFLLNQSEQLIIDSDAFLEKVSFLFVPDLAG